MFYITPCNIFLWRFQYAELLILIHLDKIKSAFLCKKITVIVTVSISFVLGNNFQFFMIFHDNVHFNPDIIKIYKVSFIQIHKKHLIQVTCVCSVVKSMSEVNGFVL